MDSRRQKDYRYQFVLNISTKGVKPALGNAMNQEETITDLKRIAKDIKEAFGYPVVSAPPTALSYDRCFFVACLKRCDTN